MTQLHEGLKNIEDLDARSFISAVRNLASSEISEKLNGASFWVGLNENGELFTSRPSEHAERFFAESEYPYFAANNGLRAAHAAFEKVFSDLEMQLDDGEILEAQIVYGGQASNLDEKSFIAILKGANEASDGKAKELSKVLNGKEVSVKSAVVFSDDGENLDQKDVNQSFEFVSVPQIKVDSLKNINVEKELKALEKYLDDDSIITGLDNFSLISTSLSSIPVDERAAVKTAREKAIATIKSKFKLPIKQQLLDQFVSKLKPSLVSSGSNGGEGVDGIIFKNPETGEALKLSDRSSLDAVKQFNYALKDQITGQIRTIDDSAPIEARGGLVGIMKIRLASLLGNKELALARVAKQVFADAKGDAPSDTAKAVANSLNGSDFNGVQRKTKAVIEATLEELAAKLTTFKKNKDNPVGSYRLKLKSGKTVGLSPEAVKRTLLTFAEVKRNLQELHDDIVASTNFEAVVSAIFNNDIKAAAQVKISEEFDNISIVSETRNDSAKARYKDAEDAWAFINIYLATLLMSILIYKAQDTRGLRFVRDKTHHRLSTWSVDMSPLNFWGWALWHPTKPAVAKLLQKKTAAQLAKIVKKVPPQWIRFLHLDLSFGGDVPIDWHDHHKTIKWLLQHAPGQNSDRIKALVEGGFKYDELSYDEKIKWLPKIYFYAQQYVPTSPLLHRVKAIQEKLLVTGADDETQPTMVMTKNQKLLGEDGEITTASQTNGATATATTTQDIANVPTGLGRQLNIVRRKRNPAVKRKKFERPTKDEE